MRILGVETSCDETGIAIYDANHGLLSHVVHSQTDIHAAYGGVVPELASRDHLNRIAPLIQQTLSAAELTLQDIDGIAYTKGPGLIGALFVGATVSKSLGFALNIPTLGVHHLEAHLLAPFLDQKASIEFPFLALLVSGGHTELIRVVSLGQYELLGDTLDDAVGEAFDKTAKLLGLGYPGGAALATLAEKGRPDQFHFPRPMTNRPGLDFSFSGLKTFAANTVAAHKHDEQAKADIAYAFETAVIDTLCIKVKRALKITRYHSLVIAGGVSANKRLRSALTDLCQSEKVTFHSPDLAFCTDNGAMIAYTGCQRMLRGEKDDSLVVNVLPRWPLEAL